MLIPQQSTYELQGKHFVYLVDRDTVKSTEIKTLPTGAGQYYVVTNGLKAGDTLVFEAAAPIADGHPPSSRRCNRKIKFIKI